MKPISHGSASAASSSGPRYSKATPCGTISNCHWRAAAAWLESLFHRCRGQQKSRIEEVLETVGLSSQASRIAAHLSHGQKQWLEIGMLLAQEPKLLLVDEPVAGMTDDETAETASTAEAHCQ